LARVGLGLSLRQAGRGNGQVLHRLLARRGVAGSLHLRRQGLLVGSKLDRALRATADQKRGHVTDYQSPRLYAIGQHGLTAHQTAAPPWHRSLNLQPKAKAIPRRAKVQFSQASEDIDSILC